MSYSKRFAASVVGIILILIIWLSGFYSPKSEMLQALEYRNEELSSQLSTLKNMSMSIGEFEKSVDSLRDSFDRDVARMRSKGEFNDRITRISDLAAANHVKILIVNPSVSNLLDISEASQMKYLGYVVEKNAIMVQVTGKYLDVGRYMERLNELDGVFIERAELLSDPMVYPDLNVFAYLFMYSRSGGKL